MTKEYKCPKCGGEIEDLRMVDEWGWFADEPFHCVGYYTGQFPEVSRDCSLNRTKSCGYFGLEDLDESA